MLGTAYIWMLEKNSVLPNQVLDLRNQFAAIAFMLVVRIVVTLGPGADKVNAVTCDGLNTVP